MRDSSLSYFSTESFSLLLRSLSLLSSIIFSMFSLSSTSSYLFPVLQSSYSRLSFPCMPFLLCSSSLFHSLSSCVSFLCFSMTRRRILVCFQMPFLSCNILRFFSLVIYHKSHSFSGSLSRRFSFLTSFFFLH